jgi:hypothetical protein
MKKNVHLITITENKTNQKICKKKKKKKKDKLSCLLNNCVTENFR